MTNYFKGLIGSFLSSNPLFSLEELDTQSILFIVLIALSFIVILVIIHLIRMISRLTKIVLKDENDKDEYTKKQNSHMNQYENIYEDINLDDKELVAVITAAVMAYLGDEAPADGLVVRSIRKVNKRKHSNSYGL